MLRNLLCCVYGLYGASLRACSACAFRKLAFCVRVRVYNSGLIVIFTTRQAAVVTTCSPAHALGTGHNHKFVQCVVLVVLYRRPWTSAIKCVGLYVCSVFYGSHRRSKSVLLFSPRRACVPIGLSSSTMQSRQFDR
jgi:hypothetical protein